MASRAEEIAKQDTEIKAWRAFSDKNASRNRPINEFHTGSLAGFSVGVKDIIDVAGLPTRCGSAIYDDAANATVDAACVALMRSAGAEIIGKTVTTELATFVPSITRNPRNLDHTPGGSSAGSAAAVAAEHVRIAIGTQTAGSVLRPAAYCGVFGYKPSFDLVPRTGVKVQSETLDTVGVFARNATDCGAWLAAMSDDPVEVHTELAPTRVAIVSNWLAHASADMRDALARAQLALAAAGVSVTSLELPPPFDQLHEQQRTIQNYESARAYSAERLIHRSKLSPDLLATLDEAAALPRVAYLRARAAAESARQLADDMFSRWDIWLMPAAPGAAPQGLASTGDPLFNRLASVLHTPAISIPAYVDAHGMPLGLQVIGRRFDDVRLLSHAAHIHQILTGNNL